MTEDKIRVSIVEDTEDIREALRVLINGSSGFECVHLFVDAEEAVDQMPDKDINVVLMDINLPGMDGIGCMKALKPFMPNINQFMFHFKIFYLKIRITYFFEPV